MFGEIKNAAILAAAVHLSGVLGHGSVRKITIDGTEYVHYLTHFPEPKPTIFLASLV